VASFSEDSNSTAEVVLAIPSACVCFGTTSQTLLGLSFDDLLFVRDRKVSSRCHPSTFLAPFVSPTLSFVCQAPTILRGHFKLFTFFHSSFQVLIVSCALPFLSSLLTLLAFARTTGYVLPSSSSAVTSALACASL